MKSPSPFEENRAQGVGLGMYEAEIRFMKELDAHTTVRTPRVFLADIVSGTAEFVVVMEDLGHLVMGDQVEGVSVAMARDAVLTMADLHAGWWGKVQTPRDGVGAERGARPHRGPRPDVAGAVDGLQREVRRLAAGGGRRGGRADLDQLLAVMNKIAEWPWTLLHQDYRVDNLFFDADNRDEPVVVIDWQGIGRGPAIYDLCYFLGGSLTIEDRRANEHELVEAYHARLVERGITDYPLETLRHDYRFGHLTSCSTAVLVGATFDLANERGTALVDTLASRHFQAVVDNRSTELLSELDA